MPISVECPSCASRYKVKDGMAGKKVICRNCRVPFDIPLAGAFETGVENEVAPSSSPATPPQTYTSVTKHLPTGVITVISLVVLGFVSFFVSWRTGLFWGWMLRYFVVSTPVSLVYLVLFIWLLGKPLERLWGAKHLIFLWLFSTVGCGLWIIGMQKITESYYFGVSCSGYGGIYAILTALAMASVRIKPSTIHSWIGRPLLAMAALPFMIATLTLLFSLLQVNGDPTEALTSVLYILGCDWRLLIGMCVVGGAIGCGYAGLMQMGQIGDAPSPRISKHMPPDNHFCPRCGFCISPGNLFCSNCGAPLGGAISRSRLVAGLLGIFLGGLGVHRFYLGYFTLGVAQILITLATLGIGALWGFIEGIVIISGGIKLDADNKPIF